MSVTASPCSFSKKNGPIKHLDQNPHQTVARFGCFGFSMYVCGFSVLQMRQFSLFTYPPRLKWASSEKMIFSKHILQHYHDFQSNNAIFPSVVQAYTQPYSFGGRIKLIICQSWHELSVTIHEISTSCKKKKTLDGGPYIIWNFSLSFHAEHYQYKSKRRHLNLVLRSLLKPQLLSHQ